MLDGQYITAQVQQICDKPLRNLPVAKDLLRLCRKFQFFSYRNESIGYVSEAFIENIQTASVERILYSLLHHLRITLQPTTDNFTFDDFVSNVNTNSHYTLADFIVQKFGESSKISKLLKVCHQSVVVMFLGQLRNELSKSEVSFKDCRGAWKIVVHTGPNPLTMGRPSVSHNRTEIVYTREPREPEIVCFKFEWQLKVIFDAQTTEISDVQISLVDIVWESEEYERRFKAKSLAVSKAFSPLIDPQSGAGSAAGLQTSQEPGSCIVQ